MKKDMLLTFKSKITNEQTGDDSIEFLTDAQFVKKNDKYYVTFSDLDEFETNKTKTTLKIENEKVTLLRFGGNNTQFIFEQGKHHTGHYETQFGAFSVGVFSDSVSIDINDNGGDLKVSYGVYLNDLISQYNNLSINIKEKSL